ncbi:MAG: hypothetical protein QXS42_02430 [Zestosphaera sp.]
MPFFFVAIGTYLNAAAFFNSYTLLLLPVAFIGKLLGFLIYARVATDLSLSESLLGVS